MFGLAALSIALVPQIASAQASFPTVSGLPESNVIGTQSQVPLTGPTGPTYSTFTVTSPATGPVSVAGGPVYNVWCWNPYGNILGTPVTYNAYSSYDPNFLSLPGTSTATAWEEVNWLINNPHGTGNNLNPTVMDLQYIIWDLLIPGPPLYAPTSFMTADGVTLYNEALADGPGFTPQPGQLLAVPLYVQGGTGINSNDGQNNAQDIFVELPLPTTPQVPGLKITKSASVTTAKCSDEITYTYVVTNTGNVTLTNVTIVDDNATPDNPNDDITIASGVTLQPGQSKTYTRTLYLPITYYGVDANGNPSTHTLVTQVLPNGNIQVSLLEDLGLVDNSYGSTSSPDWGPNGNNPLSHLGQDSAEFQFVDGAGNVVLDFAADYVSMSRQYPSGVGTAGISGGAGHLYSGNASNIVSIDTTITDNLNQAPVNWGFMLNSPPPGYKNWNFRCGYTVVVKGNCFGQNGFGGCNLKKIQHGKCKTGYPYQCQPVPMCKNITNTVTATATADVNGTNETLTATAQATVQLTPGGQQSCQPPPPCKCTCWNCQHGDHQHCQNTQCHDQGCKEQHCPQQQICKPQPCRPQDWWNKCQSSWHQSNW